MLPLDLISLIALDNLTFVNLLFVSFSFVLFFFHFFFLFAEVHPVGRLLRIS